LASESAVSVLVDSMVKRLTFTNDLVELRQRRRNRA